MPKTLTLHEQLILAAPTLTDDDFDPDHGTILLRNDSDGFGDYVAKWEHKTVALPEGFTVGKTK